MQYFKCILSSKLLMAILIRTKQIVLHIAPKLDMYSLILVETTNDVPFCLVETSEGTYLLSYWKHIKYILRGDTRDYLLNIVYFY